MAYRHHSGVYDPKFKLNRERRELEDLLSEWYGREFAESEITCRTDEPARLADLLDGVLEKFVDNTAVLTGQLQAEFPQMLGAPLNKFAELITVRENTAVIEVRHPAFLIELRKNSTSQDLLDKINQAYPDLGITALNFVPAGQYGKN